MADRNVISGRVVDSSTGAGMGGLRVEALDAAGLFRDLLGYARTDADGQFRMELLAADLAALVGPRAVTAYLRVIDSPSVGVFHVIADTRQAGPKWPLDGTVTTASFRLSSSRVLARLPALVPFVVSGTVHGQDGPVEGATVELYDRKRNGELPEAASATGTTDARGHYRITYDPPAQKDLADLVVRVLGSPPKESDTRCHAPPSVVASLVKEDDRWRGESAYARVESRLQQVSIEIEVPVGDFTAEQREHLACSLRLPLSDVTAASMAHSIADASSPLGPVVAFAALSRGLGTDRDSFFQHPKIAIKRALSAAVASNQVPQRYAREEDFNEAIGQWVTAAAAWALESRSDPCGLGELLAVAGVSSSSDRTSFAEQFCNSESAMPDFWDNLTGTFDKPRIQLTLQWWSLARGHLPLIEALEARRVAETEVSLADLAKFSEANWNDILGGITPSVPPGIPGADAGERKANYSRLLCRTLATAFPTKAFAGRVSVSSEHTEIKSFFDTHSTFEFGKDRLSHEPFRTTVAAMDPARKKHIKAMERVFRFAPTYEWVGEVLAKGYDSAHAVHAAGRNRFLADMTEALGAAVAHDLFTKACWQVGAANVVFAQFGAAANKLPMKVLANIGQISPQLESDIPDWQTLFGNAGGCSCTHCAGVLGPAAYLTDSLAWLDGFSSEVTKIGTTKWTALDILVGSQASGSNQPQGRRPDLPLLELTCKSAHTPQPYIDLTNELLEIAVAKDAGLTVDLGTSIKSTYEPDELAAGPEILYEVPHIGAWRSLMERVHPFTLPVCLFDRESDAYLRYLGVTRADIVETLTGPGEELAKARLGVRDDAHDSPNDTLVSGWKILLGTGPHSALDYWGGKTATNLKNVPVFLQSSGLTFTELEELLATRYVNGTAGTGAAGLAAVVLDPADGCDASEMTLHLDLEGDPVLTTAHLLRVQRFLRLRHHTGLSSTDLDLLLAAFSSTPDDITIDATMLQRITAAQTLARDLKLTVREVAALFANLDAHERWEKKSPYRQYFLNRLVDSPEPAVFTAVFITPTPAPTADLRLHKTALQQGLGITEQELMLLVSADALQEKLWLPEGELVLDSFDTELAVLPSVSQLWRHVRFARALGLKIADYLVLKAHASISAIGGSGSPESARAFVDLVREWKKQKLTVAELQWILRGFAPASAAVAPDAADIGALRSEITSAVSVIMSETEAAEDLSDAGLPENESRSRVFALLDQLLDETTRDHVLEVLRGSDSPPDDGTWRDPIGEIDAYLPGNASASGGAKDMLAGPYLPSESPAQKPPRMSSTAERFAYVAKWLDRHVRASRAVEEKIAAATMLPIATVDYVVRGLLTSQTASVAYSLLADFLPPNKPQATAEEQGRGLALVLRHAQLISRLGVGEPIPPAPEAATDTENLGEVRWIYEPSDGGLHALPAQQPAVSSFGSSERTRFARILQVVRRIGLRDRMKGGAHALRELLDLAPPAFADAQSLLVEKSGWNAAAVASLCDHHSIAATSELLSDENLQKLEKGVALMDRLGVDPEHVLAFLTLESVPPSAETGGLQPTSGATKNARDLVIFARHAAKAKLSPEEWSRVAKKVRDPFRELLRDRFVDALVPKLHASRDDLYGFHLIDVDMNACMMTSRIVQATNAVQVFVQRSFLGLDSQVKLPPQATRQWEWRKAYRVWEANRKVFLWPENWLEPELRDDMTPLFRDFLTHLSSGEITDAAAERALEKYLSGLHEIARLEPMALWYDHDAGTDHVIARTRSQPRKWFYRRRERDMSWTAWEKMEVDIDAESVLFVGANRRLYLFWPQLLLKPDRVEQTAEAAPTPPPPLNPLPELGETSEEFKERFLAWHKEMAKYQEEVEKANQPPPEQTHHYEVRVAWSSYLDGTWTPKRLSDAQPLSIANAKGDGPTGYEPKDVVLVLEPQTTSPPKGELHLLCVATPWFIGDNRRIGRFYFDACDGGRWTSKQLDVGPQLQAYVPAAPQDSRLSGAGFEQFGGDGAIVVPHVGPGQVAQKPVEILGEHKGRFFIISPSSHSHAPTHAFDRFLFSDHKAVFHARALHTNAEWTLGPLMLPGQVADPQPPGEQAAADADPVFGWAMSQLLQLPVPSGDIYALDIFEHPYACELANRLAAGGVPGLLGWSDDPLQSAQYLSEDIDDLYAPTAKVTGTFPKHDVSFEFGSTYGMYNWELFFHVPFTIAQRLSQEGRYGEAQKWFHYIFNPMTGLAETGPKRFWCVKPFHEIDDLATIEDDLASLAAKSSFAASLQALVAEDVATQEAAEDMKKQIAAMSEHPFAPHVLARLRPLAYMKNVFMRYVQNLLDWGDSLFRRDTMESIHEALTLYLLAADLLGAKPQILDHKADPPGKTFKQLLADGIDEFGNAAVEVETIVPKHPPKGFKCTDDGPPVPDFRLYFCVPPNDQLYGIWDTVADRLFKIRNCMNIDGVVRALPLFAPPIDPAILVRAFAAGVRLDQVLDALAAPSPIYRFVRLHAKAVELSGAVQSLGQALLAALEKRDGEELALLRQRHELAVLDAERELRKQAIQEARETLAGLQRARQVADTRLRYYTGLIQTGLLFQEKDAERKIREAKDLRLAAANVESTGALFGTIPDFTVGTLSGTQIGGRAIQLAAGAVARRISTEADSKSTDGSLAQTSAGYDRRAQEWKLQKSVGEKELAQLDRQIAAQEIRLAMAERELDNLDLRREHSREVDTFYRSKFTNQDLYTWMTAQIASEHYRAYQTAYDMAKKAERAYQLERGDDTSFIRFGAWDSLKKGLLAGERLLQDLRALDAAYLSRSDREREITKHISLAEVAGEQLTKLRDIGGAEGERGTAQLDLHTYHFDADYPGHYFRRIKNVALSVATVRPAADGVQCELTLLQSSCRKTSQIGDTPYPGNPYEDSLYRFSTAAVKALVTSTAENDPGMFEVSLKDEMLLPFEGSGAVSQWKIEIDHRTNRFPMHRISDVVLHLRYTAKDGGAGLREEALTYAQRAETPEPAPEEPPNGLKQRTRVFSARRDFDEAWAVFTSGQRTDDDPETWANVLELRFVQRHFRSFFGDPKVKIVRVHVSATFNAKYPPEAPLTHVDYKLTPRGEAAITGESLDFRIGEPSVQHTDMSVDVPRDDEGGDPWVFEVEAASTPSTLRDSGNHNLLRPDAFEDIWFIVTYEKQPS